MRSAMAAPRSLRVKLLVSGGATIACYTALFAYEKEVMGAFTRTDGLYPLLPVIAAFAFSFAHGAFTGYFWEALGVRARTPLKSEANGVPE